MFGFMEIKGEASYSGGRGSHHPVGGRAQEGGQSVCWDQLRRAVTAWGALVGGRRKGKDSGESWRFAGERDGVGLMGTVGLLHLEWECPANTLSCVSFQQGENVFMVPVSTLVIPPEEEAVVCDSSEAVSAGFTGGQCSTQACEMRGSLGWGEDCLCSACASWWRYDQQCPFHCSSSEEQ